VLVESNGTVRYALAVLYCIVFCHQRPQLLEHVLGFLEPISACDWNITLEGTSEEEKTIKLQYVGVFWLAVARSCRVGSVGTVSLLYFRDIRLDVWIICLESDLMGMVQSHFIASGWSLLMRMVRDYSKCSRYYTIVGLDYQEERNLTGRGRREQNGDIQSD
jgi:hypothetical protein